MEEHTKFFLDHGLILNRRNGKKEVYKGLIMIINSNFSSFRLLKDECHCIEFSLLKRNSSDHSKVKKKEKGFLAKALARKESKVFYPKYMIYIYTHTHKS